MAYAQIICKKYHRRLGKYLAYPLAPLLSAACTDEGCGECAKKGTDVKLIVAAIKPFKLEIAIRDDLAGAMRVRTGDLKGDAL